SVSCQAVGGAGGSWSLTGNAGTTPGTNYIGTSDSQPLELEVGGQRALRLEPAFSPNVIGGYSGNAVQGQFPAIGATIAGGGVSSYPNPVPRSYGRVGGGEGNVAGFYGTVSGGGFNTASGSNATVAGGNSNTASGSVSFAAGNRARAVDDGAFV